MSNFDFKFKSFEEEQKLSPSERRAYYEDIKAAIKRRKLTNTTPGATTIAQKLTAYNKKCCDLITKIFTARGFEHKVTGQENIPKDEAVIFANTHEGILDTFRWIKTIDKKCLVLHSSRVNFLFLLAQFSLGLILVDKKSKQSQRNAKYDMLNHLLNGFSIIYFPEAAWLLSPNKLHLPFWIGFLDIAQKTGKPIIPVVNCYEYDTSGKRAKIIGLRTHYCEPFYVKPDDNIKEKLEEFKEIIAAKKWELMEESHDPSIPKSMTNEDYIKILKFNHFILKLAGVRIEAERESLYGSSREEYVFQHINDIPYDKSNNLLETEEVIRLTKINKEHNI